MSVTNQSNYDIIVTDYTRNGLELRCLRTSQTTTFRLFGTNSFKPINNANLKKIYYWYLGVAYLVPGLVSRKLNVTNKAQPGTRDETVYSLKHPFHGACFEAVSAPTLSARVPRKARAAFEKTTLPL